MNKIALILGVLLYISAFVLYAKTAPEIWYRLKTLIIMPQEDSVSWADEYTLFTVIRSTNNESINIPITAY